MKKILLLLALLVGSVAQAASTANLRENAGTLEINVGGTGYNVLYTTYKVPIATGVSGLGSNVATFLATPSSANLAAALTNETGTNLAVFNDSPVFSTKITVPNNGLYVLDSDSSHSLIITTSSNLTANRSLTFVPGDADRTVTISGNATISGTNTGDQTITLTGDVTGTGTGSFPTAIANLAVTNGKIANSTIDLTTKVTSVLPAANGGTGFNGGSAANGEIPIGNGSGFTKATITPGTGITVTNGAGTITIAASGGGGTVIPQTNNFRVGLENGTAVSTTDQTSKTTLYFNQYNGSYMATYDSSVWTYHTSSNFSLALGTLTSGKNYDVFVYSSGGTLTGELSAAWTSDTARNDAIAQQDGVWVKSSDHSRRLVATIRTTSTTTTEDSNAKRFVINIDNQVPIVSKQFDTTDSWTNAGNGTWSAMNSGNAAWKFEMIFPLGIEYVEAEAFVTHTNGIISIGLDTTTTPDRTKTTFGTCSVSGGLYGVTPARYSEAPALGYHYVQAMQTTWSATTQTFYGDNGAGFSGNIAANAGLFVNYRK